MFLKYFHFLDLQYFSNLSPVLRGASRGRVNILYSSYYTAYCTVGSTTKNWSLHSTIRFMQRHCPLPWALLHTNFLPTNLHLHRQQGEAQCKEEITEELGNKKRGRRYCKPIFLLCWNLFLKENQIFQIFLKINLPLKKNHCV